MRCKNHLARLLVMCGLPLPIFSGPSYDSTYWAPPLDVQGTQIVNANGYVVQLKGFATMDPTTVTESQIVHFKNDWHITVLRVPLLTSENGPGHCWTVGNIKVNAAYLAAADSVIKWCRENKIYVLLDGWHEGGVGNTVGNWSSTVAAWSILADRYKDQDHLLWEIFNEPHNVAWTTWVPMAEQLIDTIRSRNPVSKVIVAGTANWCQEADVQTLKINRDEIIYSWHPYANVYGSIGTATWEENFGYIMTSGVAPVMATEWGFTSAADSAGYGTQLIQYLQSKGASWTGWDYSQSWGPQMLTSENPEVRNPSGNLMYDAFHDTVPVISVAVRQQPGGSVVGSPILLGDGTFRFNLAAASPVELSAYSLTGHFIEEILNRNLAAGEHSIRLPDGNKQAPGLVQGVYLLRLKTDAVEYQMRWHVSR